MVPKLYPVSLFSQMAGIFFSPEVAPRGKEVPKNQASRNIDAAILSAFRDQTPKPNNKSSLDDTSKQPRQRGPKLPFCVIQMESALMSE